MEPALGALRPILAVIGTLAASFGWVSPDEVSSLTDLIVRISGDVLAVGSIAWAAWARRQKALVQAVNAMPEVQGVVTAPTAAGRALADSIPSHTVATAGSPAAATVAGATVPFTHGGHS